MQTLEAKLRFLRHTVSLQKSAGIFLERDKQGVVVDFQIIDPTTLCKLFTDAGRTPEPPSPAYMQVVAGLPNVNLTTDDLLLIEYLQEDEIYPCVKAPEGIVAA